MFKTASLLVKVWGLGNPVLDLLERSEIVTESLRIFWDMRVSSASFNFLGHALELFFLRVSFCPGGYHKRTLCGVIINSCEGVHMTILKSNPLRVSAVGQT